MRYRALTPSGDYSFGRNKEDYIDGINAVAQAIRTKVLLFYGEWWENLGIGIPMFQSIIGQMNPDGLKMSSSLLITQRIQEISEVTSVESVEVERKGRSLLFKVKVIAEGNSTTVEVEI